MTLRVEQHTNQTQKLSPRQIQSIYLLSLTATELLTHLDEVSWENPVIEVIDPDVIQGYRECARSTGLSSSFDGESHFHNVPDPSIVPSFENYLLQQIAEERYEKDIFHLVRFLVGLLDDKGFLVDDMSAIALATGVDEKKLEEARRCLQSLHPAGVGASSVQECLSVQLRRMIPLNELACQIVMERMEDLKRNRVDTLAHALGETQEDVLEALKLIRSLNPRPRIDYENERVATLVPDVVVEALDGTFQVRLGPASELGIRIDTGYRSELSKGYFPSEIKEWIDAKYHQARTLRACLAQRNKMLLALSEAIIERQKDFFYRGPRYLVGDKMGDIAEVLGVSASTVSRAVRGKYLQCKWGTFPLRDFFSAGQIDAGGSLGTVKDAIAEIIRAESAEKPLSDEKIRKMLAERSMDVSRRSIARYREELGILSSSERKYRR